VIKGDSFSGVEHAVSMSDDGLSLEEGLIAMAASAAAEEVASASRFLALSDLLRFNAEEMMDLTELIFFGCFDDTIDCVVAVGSGFFIGEGSTANFFFVFACFFFRVGFIMPKKSSPKPYAPPIVVRLDAFGVLESRRGGGSAEVDFSVSFSLPGRDDAAAVEW
jgi:hypothetical protein